jgi:hypothetical protein
MSKTKSTTKKKSTLRENENNEKDELKNLIETSDNTSDNTNNEKNNEKDVLEKSVQDNSLEKNSKEETLVNSPRYEEAFQQKALTEFDYKTLSLFQLRQKIIEIQQTNSSLQASRDGKSPAEQTSIHREMAENLKQVSKLTRILKMLENKERVSKLRRK